MLDYDSDLSKNNNHQQANFNSNFGMANTSDLADQLNRFSPNLDHNDMNNYNTQR